ncbi:MAG: hypothetical protein ACK58N_19250 [Synechocystis sp.]
MKNDPLPIYGITILLTSTLLQQSVFAEVKPRNSISQQSYTPSKLQWLFTHFLNEKSVCFRTPNTNHPVAYSTWRRPEENDNELTLYVSAEDDFQLDSCTLDAFEKLRNASFEMKIEPPKVKLTHYLNDQNGNTLLGSRIYQCTVPVQLKDHRTDLSYDNAYSLGNFQNICK